MSVSLVCRRRWGAFAVAIAASALLAGCSAGLIHGELQGQNGAETPVRMTWEGNDRSDRGTMRTTVDGTAYSGPFFEMTPRTAYGDVAPLWDHWREGWTDWPYRSGDDAVTPELGADFMHRYAGKVVANLAAAGGARMRCRFDLNTPPEGMFGGGHGECQLQHGATIRASF